MMVRSNSIFRGFLLAVISLLMTRSDQATPLTVDASKSQITLSGKVGGFTLSEQGPGSLTTTVGGTIDFSELAGQIQITGATLDPNVNGNWAPGRNQQATSPADLAGTAQTIFGPITGALRDLLVTAKSDPKPLNANGQFDASSIVFSIPPDANSTLDFDSFITGKGSEKLASNGTNQTATVGTLISNKGVQTLTLALDAIFYFSLVTDNDTSLRLKGQIVASGVPGPSVPSIGGVELVNGQLRITVSGANDASQLEGSTNLRDWAPVQATGTPATDGTRTFTVPASGKFQFFRLKQ